MFLMLLTLNVPFVHEYRETENEREKLLNDDDDDDDEAYTCAECIIKRKVVCGRISVQ